MKKTKKMLDVEARIGQSLDNYLQEEYVERGRTTVQIAHDFGVRPSTIGRWLRNYCIDVRDQTASKLIKKLFPAYIFSFEITTSSMGRNWPKVPIAPKET